MIFGVSIPKENGHQMAI